MTTNVCILDYQSGNVKSVYNLISSITDKVVVSHLASDIAKASHLILPGVGAFRAAMQSIKQYLPLELIEEKIFSDKTPIMGICVGMQVMASQGEEFGETDGLNWIKGRVKKLRVEQLPLPHVGWNDIAFNENEPLFEGLAHHKDFYFVHQYHFVPENAVYCIATTDYGQSFTSVIRKDNIIGVQFHPEKSQQAGQQLLLNFLKANEEK